MAVENSTASAEERKFNSCATLAKVITVFSTKSLISREMACALSNKASPSFDPAIAPPTINAVITIVAPTGPATPNAGNTDAPKEAARWPPIKPLPN